MREHPVGDYKHELQIDQLLRDINLKAEQLMADDSEAHNAGISDVPLPILGDEDYLEEEEDSTGKEAWKQMRLIALKEREQTVWQRRKQYFQTMLRHHVINEWIRENTKLETTETPRLRETILEALRKDRSQELKTYLADVLDHGITKADKNVKRRRRGGWAWL